ncbi:hypothetical protein V7111_15675 [Neobacillus niacini]|uniref:hypothetical protein n=1 Tax=Neobacillus niacini TaxID=86668 RepID=UPI003001EC5E
MATLCTGPFLVPKHTCNGNPVNFFFICFTNLSNRRLTATVKMDHVFIQPNQPQSPCIPLHPPASIRVEPNSAVILSHSVFPPIPISNSNPLSNSPHVLIVTVSGNVDKSRDFIQVCVTGGFSSDGGSSLSEAEPTMFFRHDDFIVVHHGDLPISPHHPLNPNRSV